MRWTLVGWINSERRWPCQSRLSRENAKASDEIGTPPLRIKSRGMNFSLLESWSKGVVFMMVTAKGPHFVTAWKGNRVSRTFDRTTCIYLRAAYMHIGAAYPSVWSGLPNHFRVPGFDIPRHICALLPDSKSSLAMGLGCRGTPGGFRYNRHSVSRLHGI